MEKYVYAFSEGNKEMRNLLGVITSYSIHYTKLYENNTFSNKIEIKTTLNIFFIIAFIILSILMGFMVFITFQLKENDGATRIFQLAVIFIAFTLIYRNIKYCKEALETVDILLRSIDIV